MPYMTHISEGAKTYGQRVACHAEDGNCPNMGHAVFADKGTFEAYRTLDARRGEVRDLLYNHPDALSPDTMERLSKWMNDDDPSMDPRNLINNTGLSADPAEAKFHAAVIREDLARGRAEAEAHEEELAAESTEGTGGLRKDGRGAPQDGDPGYNHAGDNAWVRAAFQDVGAWEAAWSESMARGGRYAPKPVDWDRIQSLMDMDKVGVGADHPDPVRAYEIDGERQKVLHEAYREMERAYLNDRSMRGIESFRLGRAIAYKARRLTDEMDVLGQRICETTGAEKPPETVLQRESREENERYWAKRRADEAAAAARPGTGDPAQDRRRQRNLQYFPGTGTTEVVGVDIETCSSANLRFPTGDLATISNLGFASTDISKPADQQRPDDYTTGDAQWDKLTAGNYGMENYDFGAPDDRVRAGNTFTWLTGITTEQLTRHKPLDEDIETQHRIVDRLTSAPFVAHNASFEDSFFNATLDGYIEAKRAGRIRVIDTMQMSREWENPARTEQDAHPNSLQSVARRWGTLPDDLGERHLGLQDTVIMNNALRNMYQRMKETGTGAFGPEGTRGAGGRTWIYKRIYR